MSLNNREFVCFLLVLIVFIFLMRGENFRKAIKGVVCAFLHKKVLVVLFFALLWVALIIGFLSKISLWGVGNLKTTIFWIASSFLLIMNFSEISSDKNYFKKSFKSIFSISVIISFVGGAYDFSIVIEFILLLLVIFFLLLGYAAERGGNVGVHKFSVTVVAIFGFCFFANGVVNIYSSEKNFMTIHNFREFVLPMVMSILFMPFLYILNAVSCYEQLKLKLRFSIESEDLRKYAFGKALTNFRLDMDGLRRLGRNLQIFNPVSRSDVLRIINEIKFLKEKEVASEFIDSPKGWSPYNAISYLDSEGFVMDDYHMSYDYWCASSNVVTVKNKSIFDGSIVYAISGEEDFVNKLNLNLHVLDGRDCDESSDKFFFLSGIISDKASMRAIDVQCLPFDADGFCFCVGCFTVEYRKNFYPNSSMNGYEMNFTISRNIL